MLSRTTASIQLFIPVLPFCFW